jgi:hypothetical protein
VILKHTHPMHFKVIIVLSIFFTSCSNDSKVDSLKSSTQIDTTSHQSSDLKKADIFVDAAIETCDCMQPMIEKVKKIDFLIKDYKREAAEKEEEELSKIKVKVELCSNEIREKYGSMSTPSQQKLMLQALKEYCPDSYEILNKGISTNEN